VVIISNPVAKELVYGGHLGALGASSFAASCSILMGRTPTLALLFMAYLFTYGAYMINRGSEVSEDRISNPLRTGYLVKRSRYLTPISIACFVVGYSIAAFSGYIFFFALLVPLALALIYSVETKKLQRFIGARRLKDKLLVKNIVISLSWSLIPIFVGLYFKSFPLVLLAFAPFIFLRIMPNTIFFDLRDVKSDAQYGVRTYPVVFGSSMTYRLMDALDILSASYLIVLAGLSLFPLYSIILIVLPAYSVVYRWFSRRPHPDWEFLSTVVADGEDILWGPLTLLGSLL
jgi:4-hydroxybenzoate polyprenyltransferase